MLHQSADVLSWLPLPANMNETQRHGGVLMITNALTPHVFAQLTQQDSALSKAYVAVSSKCHFMCCARRYVEVIQRRTSRYRCNEDVHLQLRMVAWH